MGGVGIERRLGCVRVSGTFGSSKPALSVVQSDIFGLTWHCFGWVAVLVEFCWYFGWIPPCRNPHHRRLHILRLLVPKLLKLGLPHVGIRGNRDPRSWTENERDREIGYLNQGQSRGPEGSERLHPGPKLASARKDCAVARAS